MTVQNQRNKLASAAATVMFSMVLSRATGFLRSTLIPNLLEKNESDALFAAFSITNFMYFLLVGGAIAAALIPVLSGYLARQEEKEGWLALSSFINCIFFLMLILSTLGIIFSEQIVGLTAAKLNIEAKKAAIEVTRIMFPSVCFIMLAGLTNGVLNSYRRFAAAAYGPAVYNVGTVISLIFLNKYGVNTIAWGIMGSSLFYFLFQFSFAFKHFKLYKPVISFRNKGFNMLVKLAIPSLLASSVIPLNVLVSQHFASYYGSGSLTAYSNATDIWQLPYGIFAMGLGTALLPTLSEKYALGNLDEYSRVLNKGLKSVIYLIIPSSAAFLLLSEQVVSVIYKWSPQFDNQLISKTAALLMWFTLALIAQSMLAILNRAFYARNDVKTPVITGIFALAINIIVCYLLVRQGKGLLGLGGIALAYSIQSIIYAIMLIYLLGKKLQSFNSSDLLVYILKVTSAAAVMSAVLYLTNKIFPMDYVSRFNIQHKIAEIIHMAGEIVVGFTTFFIASVLLGIKEAKAGKEALKVRLKNFIGLLSKVKK